MQTQKTTERSRLKARAGNDSDVCGSAIGALCRLVKCGQPAAMRNKETNEGLDSVVGPRRPPNVPLLRVLWSLVGGIQDSSECSWAVLAFLRSYTDP